METLSTRARWILPLAIAGILLGLLIGAFASGMSQADSKYRIMTAFDYDTYVGAARRWLAGGSFYEPYQLSGPYTIFLREILYPPVVLLLLIPFTLLPPFMWWAIPLGLTGAILAWHRPSPWGLVAILVLLLLPAPFDAPWALNYIATGNPGLWIIAAVAAGTCWSWPGVLVLLKPSLFPFAVVGMKSRGWWVTLAVLAVVSLALFPLWLDYVTVLLNARGPRANIFYSLISAPATAVPLVAWLTGKDGQRTPHLLNWMRRAMPGAGLAR